LLITITFRTFGARKINLKDKIAGDFR
jgi:hypothetical protein